VNDRDWLESEKHEVADIVAQAITDAYERGKNAAWSQATWQERLKQVIERMGQTDDVEENGAPAPTSVPVVRFEKADTPRMQHKLGKKTASLAREMHRTKGWEEIANELGFGDSEAGQVAIIQALAGLTWPVEKDKPLYDYSLLLHPMIKDRRQTKDYIKLLELDGLYPFAVRVEASGQTVYVAEDNVGDE
jgi:hypothetical protein